MKVFIESDVGRGIIGIGLSMGIILAVMFPVMFMEFFLKLIN